MEALDELLSSLRLTGGVILEAQARGDWCVSSQFRPEDVAAMFPGGGPLIGYHYIHSGRVFAQVDDDPPLEAPAGTVVLLPRNRRHRLYTAPSDDPFDSHDFISAGIDGGLARFEIGEGDVSAEFYCGFLGVPDGSHPLLECLPPLMVVDVAAAQEEWVESSLKLLTSERQTPPMIARIADLLFATAVRTYVAELPDGEGGWLRGLRDPAVARALQTIHQRYSEELDVELLAREAGVSRSVLGERFAEMLGEPPMRYCARWRMRMAANMLRDDRDSTGNVAYAVGFNSEAAFNRAFKREYGEPPVTWKRRVMRQADAAAGPDRKPEARVNAVHAVETTGRCRSSDGTRIGYSAMSDGPPVMMPAVWYHQIGEDWHSPVWTHWLAEAIDGRRLVRSDLRGTGTSMCANPRWSLDLLVDDFLAVADALAFERFDILAFAHGSLVALAVAARHPARVRSLALIGGYARGYGVRADPEELRRRHGLTELARVYKGGDDGTFAQMLGSMYWPGARGETVDWFTRRLKTVNQLDEGLQNEVLRSADLQGELARVRAPTLLLHSKRDRVVDLACSREMAAAITGARLIELDSDNHVVIGTEPAWAEARAALRGFWRDHAPIEATELAGAVDA